MYYEKAALLKEIAQLNQQLETADEKWKPAIRRFLDEDEAKLAQAVDIHNPPGGNDGGSEHYDENGRLKY